MTVFFVNPNDRCYERVSNILQFTLVYEKKNPHCEDKDNTHELSHQNGARCQKAPSCLPFPCKTFSHETRLSISSKEHLYGEYSTHEIV